MESSRDRGGSAPTPSTSRHRLNGLAPTGGRVRDILGEFASPSLDDFEDPRFDDHAGTRYDTDDSGATPASSRLCWRKPFEQQAGEPYARLRHRGKCPCARHLELMGTDGRPRGGHARRDSCVPYCALGRTIDQPALVVLSEPRTTTGQLLFTLVTVQRTSPGAQPFSQCIPAYCSAGTRAPSTTTTLGPPPFPFVDSATRSIDLNAAWQSCFGFDADSSYQQQFLTWFVAREAGQSTLGEVGKTYFVPDPSAGALAYARATGGGIRCIAAGAKRSLSNGSELSAGRCWHRCRRPICTGVGGRPPAR